MSLWIKICGNTSLEDARLAVDAGADALGFVFAPSPRQVTVSQVAAITPHLPLTMEKIGVFVDPDLEQIYTAVRVCGLTGVQLHSATGPDLPAKLREHLGPAVRILRVVHFSTGESSRIADQLVRFGGNPHIDAVLVDSRSATAVGGTGVAFNWVEARKTVFGEKSGLKLIAAGGLNPDNVAQAIHTLRPWGVDVASGVEQQPGRKHPDKVREFVSLATEAGKQLTAI
jgi:phosphoribosylanthranilate isomerase